MLDLSIVLIFVIYSVVVGIKSKRVSSSSLEEYFLAGRGVPGWKAGMSMAATQFAADTPLLVTGLIASGGVFLLWRLWVYGIAFLFLGFLFGASWQRSKVITDAEFTTLRYSGGLVTPLRMIKAVFYGTVINCAVLAMVIVASLRIAEVFLPWHEWLPQSVYAPLSNLVSWSQISLGSGMLGLTATVYTTNSLLSILALVGFTFTYSTLGGLRGVIQTDVMQLIIALAGSALYAWCLVERLGGIDQLVPSLSAASGLAEARQIIALAPPSELALSFITLVGLQWLFQMNSDGTGYLAQRAIACRSERDIRVAALVFAWIQIVLRSLIWIIIAVALLSLYPSHPTSLPLVDYTAGREMTFVYGVTDFLPAGARGLMLTALLAALASTIDTHLNWGASYWSNDIYHELVCRQWLKRTPDSRELVMVARLSTALVLGLGVFVAAHLGSIQQAWTITLVFGAGLGPVLILRWLWERMNAPAEMAAIAVAGIMGGYLVAYSDSELFRLLAVGASSSVCAIVVSLLSTPTDQTVLDRFFLQVEPPGWWSNTAWRVGVSTDAPKNKLFTALRTVALCSLSMFLLLGAVVRLILPFPNEQMLWPMGMIALALLLVPIWWNEVSTEHHFAHHPS